MLQFDGNIFREDPCQTILDRRYGTIRWFIKQVFLPALSICQINMRMFRPPKFIKISRLKRIVSPWREALLRSTGNSADKQDAENLSDTDAHPRAAPGKHEVEKEGLQYVHMGACEYAVLTAYCLPEKSTQNRVATFDWRCVRLIFNLFFYPTVNLCQHFWLPSVEEKYKKSVIRRTNNI